MNIPYKMNRTETRITDKDIQTIKRKVKKTKVFIFVFLSFIALWSWGLSDSDTLFSIFNAIVFVIILIALVVLVLSLKRLKVTRNDLAAQIKIVNTFKVIDKYYTLKKSSNYFIVFDSKDIPKYQVAKKTYSLINIDDFIEIEYSKFAFWILKIEHNGNDIENKQNAQ